MNKKLFGLLIVGLIFIRGEAFAQEDGDSAGMVCCKISLITYIWHYSEYSCHKDGGSVVSHEHCPKAKSDQNAN